jgi:hypothetical protein
LVAEFSNSPAKHAWQALPLSLMEPSAHGTQSVSADEPAKEVVPAGQEVHSVDDDWYELAGHCEHWLAPSMMNPESHDAHTF